MRQILCPLITIYFIALFGRIILSWFPMSPESPIAPVFRFLYVITEPVMAPIRRVIPPLGVGGMALDLSPIIVFIVLELVHSAIC